MKMRKQALVNLGVDGFRFFNRCLSCLQVTGGLTIFNFNTQGGSLRQRTVLYVC